MSSDERKAQNLRIDKEINQEFPNPHGLTGKSTENYFNLHGLTGKSTKNFSIRTD